MEAARKALWINQIELASLPPPWLEPRQSGDGRLKMARSSLPPPWLEPRQSVYDRTRYVIGVCPPRGWNQGKAACR